MSPQMKFEDVPGWLKPTDRLVFEWLMTWQSKTEPPGDVVELGVYQGKSAIHIGNFVLPDERFTVCDLFDDAGSEPTIRADVRKTYRTLSQAGFEKNYLAFHDKLPIVLRGLSSIIESNVESDTCRLVHIDASHIYGHVRADTAAAANLLRTDGIVVFDDFRTEHTVGTAAAVWEAVISDGLRPICTTSMKFYATWGDPRPAQAELFRQISNRTDHRADVHVVQRGDELIRIAHIPPKSAPKPTPAPTPAAAPASVPRRAARRLRRSVRALVG